MIDTDLPINYNSSHWTVRREAREWYVMLQDNKCWHCGISLDVRPENTENINWNIFPDNFLKYPVHLHHDHVSGMTIGAVHAYCNAVLWQFHGQ